MKFAAVLWLYFLEYLIILWAFTHFIWRFLCIPNAEVEEEVVANQHSKWIVITPVPKSNNIFLQVTGLHSLVVTKVAWKTVILSKYFTMRKEALTRKTFFSLLEPLEFNIVLLSSDFPLVYLSSSTVCLCLLLSIYFFQKIIKEQIRCLVLNT